MTVPSVSLSTSPTIEALRAELTACETMTLQMGVLPLIAAAKAVINEHDAHMAYVRQMAAVPRPSNEEIRAQLDAAQFGADRSPNIVNTGAQYINQPGGQARGTLDP